MSETPPKQEKAAEPVSRRQFFWWMTAGWASVLSFGGALTAWSGRFFMPRAIYEASPQFKVGYPEEFAVGSVTKIPGRSLWVVHYSEGFQGIESVCTHLGCTPNWIEAERLFRCPCHGSVYDEYAANIAGPAPFPMRRAKLTLTADGRIQADISKMYTPQNFKQSHDPKCFLDLSSPDHICDRFPA
ncbi:MAG: ubiquinol-cytochrome c reductase iron-sulfur subunit [bacterium]